MVCMNRLKVTLKHIFSKDSLHIVEFSFCDEPLYMMSLELNQNIVVGAQVEIGIKPTHVAIMEEFSVRNSFVNQVRVSIVNIEYGELLCSIKGALNGEILEAVITTKACDRLQLGVGESVVMVLPASEIAIL